MNPPGEQLEIRLFGNGPAVHIAEVLPDVMAKIPPPANDTQTGSEDGHEES